MGDAIHRHPPTNGLGSNTCIQDGFNLAWKLAMVIKGQAAPSLLETYNSERAPIAKQIVKRANDSLELFNPIMAALGLVDTQDPEQMQKNIDALKDSTPQAAKRRAELIQAMDYTNIIYNGHGVEMNQRYVSAAVALDGTDDPGFERDEEMYHQPSSRPGAHVPHAVITRSQHKVSTLDLCGQGEFSLLTGIGGEAWKQAAAAVEETFGIELKVHVIGPGQIYEDPYGQFAHRRETAESGAILVRPDFIVGWRAQEVSTSATEDLVAAMAQILGRADGEILETSHVDQISLKDNWL